MIELVCLLGLFVDVRCVYAELRLGHNHVSVAEVYHEIAIRGIKAILDSHNLELLSALCSRCFDHAVEHLHDLLRSVPVNLAPQQIVDEEPVLFVFDEVFPRTSELNCFEEV